MSSPIENPGPEQPGSQPPAGGYGSQPGTNAPQPPTPGYQAPPPGYQAPPQYQQPQYQAPPPGYQQPAGAQPGAGDFKFEMPTDIPHSMNDVMPKGGFSGIFNTTGLPTLLKVSYILWLVTAGLWLLTTLFGFIFSIIALGARDNSLFGVTIPGSGDEIRAAGVKGVVVSIIALVVIAAIVVCAMKLKEGLQWPRMALTILTVVSLILVFFGAGVGLIGVVATILMWLPESTAWINSRKGLAT